MEIIEKFLDKKLITKQNTRKVYSLNIQTYFKTLGKDIDGYVIDNKTWKRYSEDKQEELEEQYNNDLRKVYKIQHENGRPDLSMRTFFNSIKQFMVFNNKYLKDLDFWDTLKNTTKGAEPESDETILNANDIKIILSHGNALSRALFLLLASSGRRISEIMALTPDDIDTNVSPTVINITKSIYSKTTKSKKKTECFISDEATEAYKVWMKERDYYLETKHSKYRDTTDPRIFPMSYDNALCIWRIMLMNAQLVDIQHYTDKWTGRKNRKIKKKNKGDRLLQHPHCLRKFFRSYLGDADFAEYLMGHSTMLTRAYRQKKPEDRAEQYRKLMPNVTIFETTSKDISDLNQQMIEKETRIQKQEEQIKKLLEAQKIMELEMDIIKNRLEIEKQKNGGK